MADISILDLQNLRHLIGGFDTSHCKMQDYASQAQDPEVQKLFQDAAQSAMKNKQDLMKFLWEVGEILDDKTMVSDALAGVNGELVRYGEMISQTENKELKATQQEIDHVKSVLTGLSMK